MEKSKVFIFVAIGILFTALIAVTVTLFFTLTSLKDMNNTNNENGNLNGENNKIVVNSEDIAILSIDEPITANLMQNNKDEDKHVLRISVGLALDKSQKDYKKINEQLTEKMPVLRHIIINVIRNKNYDEVIQPNSQELMGQEILNELNKYFQTKTITDIYFGEFFVQ
ncbi:MAG TPA: flagellar basal body-associated FliL family protein [Defluviitaleaceae bacterium]|nr:flagellar basal body-associated FliL family protein [Defluviitaleaceae bacterium]